MATPDLGIVGEHLGGSRDGIRMQDPGFIYPLPQPGDTNMAFNLAYPTGRIGCGNQ